MTPAASADVGNGIQNKTPFGGQQVQPDFQPAIRIHDHGIQDCFFKGFVHFCASQITDVGLHICFWRVGLIDQLRLFPDSMQTGLKTRQLMDMFSHG